MGFGLTIADSFALVRYDLAVLLSDSRVKNVQPLVWIDGQENGASDRSVDLLFCVSFANRVQQRAFVEITEHKQVRQTL